MHVHKIVCVRVCVCVCVCVASCMYLIEDAILLKGALLGNNHKQWLGLFPDRSRLQFLIDCSMQEWEGLEEEITCMISGRR